MADEVAVLGLGVDSSAAVNGMKTFTREVGGMTSAVKSAALALTSLFATAKITQFISGTSAAFAAYGDQMAKMSQRLDIAASKLSEMSYIASQSGTSIESFERAVRLLQRNLTSADEEAKTATASFEKLGLSIQELKQMSPDEQFKTVASAIASLESPSERTAYAMKIFSRSGAELIPFFQQGREGMDKLSEKARKLGFVMSDQDYQAAVELTDAMDTFNRSINAVRNALVAGLAPSLTDIYEKISSSAGAVVEYIREHKELVSAVLKLGTAATAVGALAGAYGILRTALMAQAAIRASLAAAKAKQIAATQADTAATIANTQAHLANNAATGAGVAATGANAAAKGAGGGGLLSKMFSPKVMFLAAAYGAGIANNFYEGWKKESAKGSSGVRQAWSGTINAMTGGLKLLPDKWKEAEKSVDPGIEKAKALGNTLTFGIAGAVEKAAELLGITKALADVINSSKFLRFVFGVKDYDEEKERQEKLDRDIAASNQRRAGVEAAQRHLQEENLDTVTGTDEWKKFEEEQEERRGRIGLSGLDLASYDYGIASDRAEKSNVRFRELESKRAELEAAAQNAKNELEAQEAYRKEFKEKLANGEINADLATAQMEDSKVAQKNAAFEQAQKELDSFLSGEFRDANEEMTKSAEEYAAVSEQYRTALAEDESRKREERQTEIDTGIRSSYAGLNSDEAAAARAKAEGDVLKERLIAMENAALEIRNIEDQLASETNLFERQNLLENLELQKGIAGTLQERLELQSEITEKNVEEEAALKRIADQERELARTREERNESLGEHARGLAENYAAKWMNDSEKVRYQRGKLASSMAQAEQFGYREQNIRDMDEMIKLLGQKAGQGGEEGRKAEEEMNRLIRERAEAEERLYADKKQNMDDQYAALNAIDDIAGSKAEKYMQDYQKEMEAWNDAQKKDSGTASIQKAVDAASAEGFAQMNRVYDTSQRKIEDHTKNIREYTRQMKQYLMQLAARGDTSWALDVEGA